MELMFATVGGESTLNAANVFAIARSLKPAPAINFVDSKQDAPGLEPSFLNDITVKVSQFKDALVDAFSASQLAFGPAKKDGGQP